MIEFWKYHGTGNDFIVIDDFEGEIELGSSVIARFCDRHFGIGADGLLMVRKDSKHGDFRMDYWNSDGSSAEMCGNGIRCFVKHIVDMGFVRGPEIIVQTRAGPKRCKVFADEMRNTVEQVEVDMGPAEVLNGVSGVPTKALDSLWLTTDHGKMEFKRVSMGNPHAVTFDIGPDAETALTIGPMMEKNPAFKHGTNVEFAKIVSGTVLELAVWERGCGLTLSCGTGACAAALAAVVAEKMEAGRDLEIILPGGRLNVNIEPDFSHIWLKGPAVRVFKGQVRGFEDIL
ncbi:MAG: diaminopimelate epimerase [Deltaproteobacteria bacterium]|nr:diaminopimelate epimerase [Deltaproteobacteria bacterium]